MNLKLKIKILSLFGTQSRFAIACGKNDNWISRIITGRQMPNEEEKILISKKLKIDDIENYLSSTS